MYSPVGCDGAFLMEVASSFRSSRFAIGFEKWPGFALVGLAVGLNPWTMSALVHKPLTDINPRSIENVVGVEGVLLAVGIWLLFRPGIVRRWREWPLRGWVTPVVPRELGRAAVPLSLLSFGLTGLGLWREALPLWHPISLLVGLECAACVVLDVALGYWLVLKCVRRPRLAAVVLLPWGLLFPVEWVSVWLAGMRFEPRMLDWAESGVMVPLLSSPSILLAAGALGLVIWAGGAVQRLPRTPSWRAVWQLALAALALHALQPGYLLYRLVGTPFPERLKNQSETIWDASANFKNGPLVHALNLYLAPKPEREVAELAEDDKEAARRLNLTLGFARPPRANPLVGQPFQRVIFLTCESLSLDFIGRYNRAMPESLTPFIDSMPESFHEIRACSFPTNAALATHYCSHPNYEALYAFRYPNSLVKVLAAEGWRTVFFRSANLAYSNGDRRFSEIGFEERYGAEWQLEQGQSDYVSGGWGACDRVTFESAISYLGAHRDERVFLGVLSADMHFPHGREDYGNLVYPDAPKWIEGHPAEALLRAVFRFDHDVGRFVAGLRSAGLWDERTLLVLTADHGFPPLTVLQTIPGISPKRYRRIPFIVMSGQPLPPTDLSRRASQTATAPTFADLLNLPRLPGWMGRSLYARQYEEPVFLAFDSDRLDTSMEADSRLGDPATRAAAKRICDLVLTRQPARATSEPVQAVVNQ